MTLVGTHYRWPFQKLEKQQGHQVDGIVRVIFEAFERGRKKVDRPEELEKFSHLTAKAFVSLKPVAISFVTWPNCPVHRHWR